MATDNVLEIKNLHTYFYTDGGVIKAVDGVDVELRRGATLGIVGESGSGKSVTSLSVMGLLAGTKGKIADGEILLDGEEQLLIDKINFIHRVKGNDLLAAVRVQMGLNA